MPPENTQQRTNFHPVTVTEQKCWYQPLCNVTPVSKYLAAIIFILLPFAGAYIGYQIAPEKVFEVQVITPVKHEQSITNNEAQTDSSAQTDSLTPFAKDVRYKTDGTFVYLFDDLYPMDDDQKIVRYVIEGADPKTFEPKIVTNYPVSQGNTYQGWISKDKNSVYYINKRIEGADPVTFVVTEEVPINKDSSNVFLYYKKIPTADPKTYEVVYNLGASGPGNVFGRDALHCYLNYLQIECTQMPSSFEEAFHFSDEESSQQVIR